MSPVASPHQEVRERLAELRRRRARAEDHAKAAKAALLASSNSSDVNSEEFRRAERAIQDLNEIRASISLTEREENYALARMAGLDGPMDRPNFLSDPAVMDELRSLASSRQPIGNMNLGYVVSKEELLADYDQRRMRMAAAGDVTLPDTARQVQYYGVIPQLRRRVRLLDLIPSSPMDSGKSFDYTRESGSFDTAAETAELALKPSGELTLTDAQVVAQTIPHWLKVARQQLSDVPALGATINTRLLYGVERRLENQIIGGDGTGDNLLGIIHTTGVGAPASVTGDSVNADLALNAIGSILENEAEPDAVCLNPIDFVKMLKVKAASGVRLDSDGAFGESPTTMWGLPVVSSTAIAVAHALVGAFGIGARIFVREGVGVRISDADQDDFLRNRVTILAEGRWGLMVNQPAAFAYVPLSFAA